MEILPDNLQASWPFLVVSVIGLAEDDENRHS